MKSKKLKGYIFSRPFMGERVPQHVQNIVLRDYCEKNNFIFLMSATEYSMKNSHLMLFQTLDDLKNFDGIVFYSLFQLPENNITRKKILDKILKMKKEIHFSLEQMRMSCKNDLEKIEEIWKVRKILPFCPNKL
tara:strand:- start:800 stop:1201 length:402 start_codon:yes stop_codon:yes gene_type:complete